MKVLLINPPVNNKKFGKFHSLMEPMPCIGLAYIAAVLERSGHTVKILDNYVCGYSFENISHLIDEFRPDITGFSVLTPSVNYCLDLASKIKKRYPPIKLIAGNVHPTLFPEEFLKPGYFDIVVRGEGENTMVEVTHLISNGGDLTDVKGISFIHGSKIYHNKDRRIIDDLDALPVPAWHFFPYKKYGLFPFADIKKPLLTILATRGCPYSCTYCSLGYLDKTYRKRSPENVADEMEYLISRFGIKQLGFVDPIFPLEHDYALELCEEMIKRGINKKIVWTTETRIDILDETIISRLRSAGCRRIIFGIETGSSKTLESVGKKVDAGKVRSTMRLLKTYGIESIGLFMIGMPGENEELIRETFDYACSIDVDFAKFAMTVPFPGSQLYDTLSKENKIRTDNWDDFTTFNPVPENVSYVPDGMTASQLIKLQKRGTLKFYLRPKMILRQLFGIRTLTPSIIMKGIYCLLPF
ncbi:B12-binding domain-containing radical SAM protein [Elusimicrobiota bacterium]